jgi:hypothetical protein
MNATRNMSVVTSYRVPVTGSLLQFADRICISRKTGDR